MSIPPAHRRLVPRRPRPPEAPEENEELDVTVRRPTFDPSVLDLGDDAPDDAPGDAPDDAPGDAPDDAPALRESTELTLVDRAVSEDGETNLLRDLAVAVAIADAADAPGARVSQSELEATLLRDSVEDDGVEARPTARLLPTENGLLAAIAAGHEPMRLHYADWLEQRGETARAALLRLDHALHAMSADDPRFLPTLQRLRALAPSVSADWRSRVSRAAIEGCSAYSGTCPMYWRALPPEAPPEAAAARTCPACGDRVYYCLTLQLAQERVQQGQRVALDLACERWPGDLDRQCDGCSGRVSPQTRFCPHCGRAMHRG
jgi:uncharacterized protein (TIGR02996 family)